MQVKQIYEFRGYSVRNYKNSDSPSYCLNLEGENGNSIQFFTKDENLAKSLVKTQRYVCTFSFSGHFYLDDIAPLKQ